jgi:hypothetical protein
MHKVRNNSNIVKQQQQINVQTLQVLFAVLLISSRFFEYLCLTLMLVSENTLLVKHFYKSKFFLGNSSWLQILGSWIRFPKEAGINLHNSESWNPLACRPSTGKIVKAKFIALECRNEVLTYREELQERKIKKP